MQYDKEFKLQALELSDEIGVKAAADQLGIKYYTLAEWRRQRKARGDECDIIGLSRKAP
jgi:transposase